MEEIKSSLVNHKSMRHVKQSLIEVSQKDGKEKFRVKTLEYINDSSYNADDKYFYDSLPFVRFLDPGEEACAYTDPYKLIWLNCPDGGDLKIGEEVRLWDFIYDHECLHQLWDTFGVAERIKAAKEEYIHKLLNVASDVVINDYLYYMRKKSIPNGVLTPEYIEKNYGVKYDRSRDTQYSLYLKLLKVKQQVLKDPNLQDMLGPKIQPKCVTKQQGPPPPPPPGGGVYPPDYVKGWVDGIKDVQDKKVDPTDPNLKPKNTGNQMYDKGYNDVISKIKEGIENGITVAEAPVNSVQNGGLPQIPWDIGDNKQQSSGGGSGDSSKEKSPEDAAQDAADSAQKSADAAQDAANSSQQNGSPDAGKKSSAAKKAQDAADKAKKAADKAKKAAASGDEKGAQDAAKEAQDAADEAANAASEAGAANQNGSQSASEVAKNAADSAKANADKAKSAAQGGGDKEQKAAKKAQAAADKAAKAAQKAADAEAKGDKEGANKAAKEAQAAADEAAVAAQEAGVDKGDLSAGTGSDAPSKGQGHSRGGTTEIFDDVDLDQLRKDHEELIKKYRNKLAGKLGEFLGKCKSSVKLDKSPLEARVKKGSNGWDNKMDVIINKYLTQKVWQLQQMKKRTYQKRNRREDRVQVGNPVFPGTKKIEQSMPLTIAFYIDRSGSMGSSLDNATKACYTLCEAIKKKYLHIKVVSDTIFKIFSFDTAVHPHKYGTKINCQGSTFDMDELCEAIEQHTPDCMVNVVITDGAFGVNRQEVKKFVERLNGILVFIINSKQRDVEQVAKMIPNQLFYLEADSNFELS